MEVKSRLEEATARVIQLEEDLIGVTQKGLQKETELDRWGGCSRFSEQQLLITCIACVVFHMYYI